jgi:hypothetical protein
MFYGARSGLTANLEEWRFFFHGALRIEARFNRP